MFNMCVVCTVNKLNLWSFVYISSQNKNIDKKKHLLDCDAV